MNRNGLRVVLFLCVAAYALAQEHTHTHPTQHHQATMKPANVKDSVSIQMMNRMHEPMMEVPFLESDNLDLNFIFNMIPHHQGAIESSEFVLKYSKNPKIRAIAQQIIKDQKAEIAEFEQLAIELKAQERLYSPKEVTLYNKQAKADMEEMSKAMGNVELVNKIDRDFLMSMTPHHQGAIDASNQILKFTQNDKVKVIAQRIIEAQTQEIKDFDKILKNLK